MITKEEFEECVGVITKLFEELGLYKRISISLMDKKGIKKIIKGRQHPGDRDNPESNANAFYMVRPGEQGVIIVNADLSERKTILRTVFHEMAHDVLEYLAMKDRKFYATLHLKAIDDKAFMTYAHKRWIAFMSTYYKGQDEEEIARLAENETLVDVIGGAFIMRAGTLGLLKKAELPSYLMPAITMMESMLDDIIEIYKNDDRPMSPVRFTAMKLSLSCTDGIGKKPDMDVSEKAKELMARWMQ